MDPIDEEKAAESPGKLENGEQSAPESPEPGLTTVEAAVDKEDNTKGEVEGIEEENKESDGEGKAAEDREGEEQEGGVGEEEVVDDEREGMMVDGFACPKHLLTKITPMEFEEMVHLFQTYDANGSGDIDKHEARKILLAMDLEATLEKAEEFIGLVDKDGSGEIEFDEFCEFIHLVKDGDERFKAFDNVLDHVSDTPLGILEKNATTQGFELRFQTIETRDATATNPPITVCELNMTGIWWERDEKGKAVGTQMTRKFQGLGVNHREAKYQAASAANVKLRQMMPGVQYKEGEVGGVR